MVREHLEGLERVLGKGFRSPGTALSWGREGRGRPMGGSAGAGLGGGSTLGGQDLRLCSPRLTLGGGSTLSHQCPPSSGGSSTCVGGGAEGAVLHPRPQGPHREQGPPTGWSALELVLELVPLP